MFTWISVSQNLEDSYIFHKSFPYPFPDLPSGQGDKTGTMLSDGAIYSSIDFTTKANYNSPGQTSQATPYATTQILHSSSIHELAVDLPESQWKASLQAKQEMANLGYSLPDKNSCNNSKIHWEIECVNSNLWWGYCCPDMCEVQQMFLCGMIVWTRTILFHTLKTEWTQITSSHL